jgi:outer membrane protein OmpA-like peptidoglycan-associated protein
MGRNFSLSVAVTALLFVSGCSDEAKVQAEEATKSSLVQVEDIANEEANQKKTDMALKLIEEYSAQQLGETENSGEIASTVANEMRPSVEAGIESGSTAEDLFEELKPEVDEKLEAYMGTEEEEEPAPEPEPEPAPEPEPEEETVVVVPPMEAISAINNSSIKSGSTGVTEENMENLEALANFLQENPTYVAHVHSYTDSTGGEEINMKLSQKRAENVRSYLIAKGASEAQVGAKGHGETNLKYPEDPTNPANRRFEIIVEVDSAE